MSKKISIGSAIAAVLLCCVATFMVSYIALEGKFEKKYYSDALHTLNGAENKNEKEDGESGGEENSDFWKKLNAKLTEVDRIFRSYYIGELDEEKIIDGVISGYVYGTGDDYAAYYNAEDFDLFMQDTAGEMAGIGVSVIFNTEYKAIEIINVLPDSPALDAGVQPGDLIVYIGEGDDMESVSELGYNPALAKLKGEIGTEAIFTVARGDGYVDTVDFRIKRAKVKEVTVMSHVYALDPEVGVIKISGFDGSTPPQFVKAVEDLQKDGCKKLVIDLRYNPGGELSSILTTLDYILPEGPIIRIFDGDGKEVQAYYSESTELNIPMAVLVNGSTASAAELFTSAVRDYKKAVIVGTTTYGKGCMQTTVPLMTTGALSVTYRMYNPPFSDNYHGIGIVPDVEVELDEALESKNIYKITDEEDNQLRAAVEALK